ncbi:MAG: trypsin-like peptidase domain-containing protein [Candidatus Levybacteria bacterium]|nr:trypsin-like peptidase domain-containing protein [Candidatus Levybacteria bacterium]
MRRLIVLVAILIIMLAVISAFSNYLPQISNFLPGVTTPQFTNEKVKIVTEESVVIDAVKKVGPSVVTIVEERTVQSLRQFEFGPFSIFGVPGGEEQQSVNIGSGFIVTKDGLIVTNKHVVSDREVKYQIITSNDKKYQVQKIYRDPLNDVALIKIEPSENPGNTLKTVEIGDSSRLQVGQFVIAIGTALGEFKNTVTTGVISGLGRGITAGDEFAGYVERLDNVIQTSAAINPGNSGGPLLNSSAQVIGVNTAVASGGQNIGFALPINVIKDSIKNFNETGQFNRPFLGVEYKMISRDLALLNEVPEGALVQNVVTDSSADKAEIKSGDIITKIDGKKVQAGGNELAKIISEKKVGDTMSITIWRDGKTLEFKVTLQTAPNS